MLLAPPTTTSPGSSPGADADAFRVSLKGTEADDDDDDDEDDDG